MTYLDGALGMVRLRPLFILRRALHPSLVFSLRGEFDLLGLRSLGRSCWSPFSGGVAVISVANLCVVPSCSRAASAEYSHPSFGPQANLRCLQRYREISLGRSSSCFLPFLQNIYPHSRISLCIIHSEQILSFNRHLVRSSRSDVDWRGASLRPC